jgi:hypothetical protein
MRICHDDRWCADAAAAGGMENMDLAPYPSRGARDVLDRGIVRLAERQHIPRVGHHACGDGDTTRIALDRDGMIGARNFGGPCGLAWYRSSAVGPWASDGAASSPLFPRGRRGAEFRPSCRALAHRAPPLSQQIRQLEGELGLQLLERGKRPLRLTEAGTYLRTEVRQITAKLDETVGGAPHRPRPDGLVGRELYRLGDDHADAGGTAALPCRASRRSQWCCSRCWRPSNRRHCSIGACMSDLCGSPLFSALKSGPLTRSKPPPCALRLCRFGYSARGEARVPRSRE